MASLLKSSNIQEMYEQALQEDKATVIRLFTEQGKLAEFEAEHGCTLAEYLSDYLTRDGIFEGVCIDWDVNYE